METPYMRWILSTEETLKRARLEEGMSVLDLGCGSGRLTEGILSRIGPRGKLICQDLQKGMLNKLLARFASHDPRLTIMEGPFEDLDFGGQRFDRILMVMVLGEITDREKAFSRIKTILKDDGLVSISEVFPDPHYQSARKVRSFIKIVGMTTIYSEGGLLEHTQTAKSISK